MTLNVRVCQWAQVTDMANRSCLNASGHSHAFSHQSIRCIRQIILCHSIFLSYNLDIKCADSISCLSFISYAEPTQFLCIRTTNKSNSIIYIINTIALLSNRDFGSRESVQPRDEQSLRLYATRNGQTYPGVAVAVQLCSSGI